MWRRAGAYHSSHASVTSVFTDKSFWIKSKKIQHKEEDLSFISISNTLRFDTENTSKSWCEKHVKSVKKRIFLANSTKLTYVRKCSGRPWRQRYLIVLYQFGKRRIQGVFHSKFEIEILSTSKDIRFQRSPLTEICHFHTEIFSFETSNCHHAKERPLKH